MVPALRRQRWQKSCKLHQPVLSSEDHTARPGSKIAQVLWMLLGGGGGNADACVCETTGSRKAGLAGPRTPTLLKVLPRDLECSSACLNPVSLSRGGESSVWTSLAPSQTLGWPRSLTD